MKINNLFIAILFCFVHAIANGQSPRSYYSMIAQARQLYSTKDYAASADIYVRAFSTHNATISLKERYDLACVWALAGNIESAFIQLDQLSLNKKFIEYDKTVSDTNLLDLHNDKRWGIICEQIKKNKADAERTLNKKLVTQLDTVFENDQKYRLQWQSINDKFGYTSPESKKAWQLVLDADSINIAYLAHFLDKYGWLGPDKISTHGSNALCLVLQHSDLKVQQKYAPLMKEAALANKIDPAWYALLQDRMALREGHKQIYGSQLHGNPNGNPWVSPMIDPDLVDERRASIGLEPMSEYLKQFNLNWDLEEYKKELPEIEVRDKGGW